MNPLRDSWRVVLATSALAVPAAASVESPNPLPPPESGPPSAASPWPRIGGQLLAGAVLTGMALSAEDPELAAARLDNFEGPPELEFVGDGRFMAASIAAVGAWGYVGGRPGARDLARDLALSWAIAGAAVGAIKVSVNRRRPNGGRYSFPSGHTATAFMAAPVLTEHFGWKVGVPAYLVASSVAVGRMEESKHYLSDVIAGAAIGLAAGTWVAFGRSQVRLEASAQSLALAMDW